MIINKRIFAVVLIVETLRIGLGEAEAAQTLSVDVVRRNITLCEMAAGKARSVVHATLDSKSFDPLPEVIRQTLAGSPERTMLLQVFQRPYLISPVLIETAGFGAEKLAPTMTLKAKMEIEDFSFSYVRNTCIVESLSF